MHSILILPDGHRYRHLSETQAAVCLIPGTVFVLIGRQFPDDLRRHHLHHIGGRRSAGSVPCTNPVAVGRARIDGPVAEGRDMRPHLANLYKFRARAVTVCSLDAEPESDGSAFGPRQKHLATASGDRHQIDWCGRKIATRRSISHSSSSPLRQVQIVKTRPVGRGNHPVGSISWKACGTEQGFVRKADLSLSDSSPGVCPMAGRGAGGYGSIHQLVVDGVMGYFRVVLHPRLQQDVGPIAADRLRAQA